MSTQSKKQGFDSFKDSRPLTSRALTSRASKSPSSASIRQVSQSKVDEEDILVNACCPNCRYIFKVVNEKKLKIIKNKLKKLQTIQQQKSVTFKNKVNSIKLVDDNQEYYAVNERQTHQKKNINAGHKDLMGDNIKTPSKKEYQKRYQQSQESQNMKKDINFMKKYLDKYKNSKYSPRSHNASMNQKTPRQQNNSLIHYDQAFFEGAQKLSTINGRKKQIQISRKCQKCQTCTIQLQIAKHAAKAKLKEEQLKMIVPHIDKQSPSYVKCLQLIMLNE